MICKAFLWTTSAHLLLGSPTDHLLLEFPIQNSFRILCSSILTVWPSHPSLLKMFCCFSYNNICASDIHFPTHSSVSSSNYSFSNFSFSLVYLFILFKRLTDLRSSTRLGSDNLCMCGSHIILGFPLNVNINTNCAFCSRALAGRVLLVIWGLVGMVEDWGSSVLISRQLAYRSPVMIGFTVFC
jgi:hypothetical protein